MSISEQVQRKVYLFKAASEDNDDDPFIKLLNCSKIDSQLVPVLTFNYSNLEDLWEQFKSPDKYEGIILTSPRCVQSITEAIKLDETEGQWENSLQNAWASKYLFCVGPSTINSALQLFPSPKLNNDMVIAGLESHADSLADKIMEVNSKKLFNGSLLYPCGAQRRDVLINKLSNAGIKCSQLTVYESVKNPGLEAILRYVSAEIKIKTTEAWLCFFSPSGVKNVFEHLDHNLFDQDSVTNIVAIGPTTKSSLEELFLQNAIKKSIHQCKNPTPEALLDILTEKNQSS